ncbi:MAG TPA: GAF domain-containing protein [Oculatellaceae cyanobacterium]|jgi:PAS domain S-box-containing protein
MSSPEFPIEEVLSNDLLKIASATGDELLQYLVQFLTKTLEVEYAIIGERVERHNSQSIRTLAVWGDGQKKENFEYDLANTPCQEVSQDGICIYPDKLQRQFPNNELLKQMGVESYFGIHLLDSAGHSLGLIYVMGRSPLKNCEVTEQYLRIFATRISSELERRTAEKELKQQFERTQEAFQRSQLLAQIALQIRQSLNLEEVLNTTVTQVRKLLGADRVVVYQLKSQLSGTVVSESVGEGLVSALGSNFQDNCFQRQVAEKYLKGYKRAIANIYEAGLADCHIKVLEQLQVKANLVVPILLQNNIEPATPYLWGLLIVHQCSSPRHWQETQLSLLDELAVQLSIAIQQSELYQQAQVQLAERQRVEVALLKAKDELEIRVTQRTIELEHTNERLQRKIIERQQAEVALKRQNLKSQLFAEITLKIRQSLQIQEILQTTVTEVQKILQVDRVLIYRVLSDRSGCTITEAVLPGLPVLVDIPFPEEVFPYECHELYKLGKVRAIEDVEQAYGEETPCLVEFLRQLAVKAKLIVPIVQNQELWGLLIAHHCSSTRLWTEFETELLEQLANQVSIALAQAQLLRALQDNEQRFRAIFHQTFQFIWLLKPDGTLLETNQTALEFMGLPAESLVNRPFWEMPCWNLSRKNQQRLQTAIAQAATGNFIRYEVDVISANGKKITIDFSIKPVTDERGEVVMLIPEGRDISDRKQAEEEIKASLKEKEILLKEIHHRVKNNLLVVSSLLEFQAEYINNSAIIKVFEDSQHRIYSMALIHEKLYQSKNLEKINFGEYIQNLVYNLISSYNITEDRIQVEFDIDPVELNIETANPGGLIVNELVSNAFKHAFPDNRSGKMLLELHQDSSQKIILIIKDNGIGFPPDLDFRNTESLGLQLVCTLTEQLEGEISLTKEEGTAFKLTFTELQYKKRV